MDLSSVKASVHEDQGLFAPWPTAGQIFRGLIIIPFFPLAVFISLPLAVVAFITEGADGVAAVFGLLWDMVKDPFGDW